MEWTWTFLLLSLVLSAERNTPLTRVSYQPECEAGASQVTIATSCLRFGPNPRGHYRRAGVRRRPEAAACSRFLLHDVMAAFVPRRPRVGLALTAGEIFRFEGNLCNAHITVT